MKHERLLHITLRIPRSCVKMIGPSSEPWGTPIECSVKTPFDELLDGYVPSRYDLRKIENWFVSLLMVNMFRIRNNLKNFDLNIYKALCLNPANTGSVVVIIMFWWVYWVSIPRRNCDGARCITADEVIFCTISHACIRRGRTSRSVQQYYYKYNL